MNKLIVLASCVLLASLMCHAHEGERYDAVDTRDRWGVRWCSIPYGEKC